MRMMRIMRIMMMRIMMMMIMGPSAYSEARLVFGGRSPLVVCLGFSPLLLTWSSRERLCPCGRKWPIG
jgi:hypothetical protein